MQYKDPEGDRPALMTIEEAKSGQFMVERINCLPEVVHLSDNLPLLQNEPLLYSSCLAMAEIESRLIALRRTFRIGKTRGLEWRKAQLRALLKLMQEKEDYICRALNCDLGKHSVEAYRDEIGIVKKSAMEALKSLEKWMAPKKCNLPLLLYPSKGRLVPEPYGTVLIFSCWNFPIGLSLDPLIGAISAGNTVLLKPSELSPSVSSFLAEFLPLYLDPEAFEVVEGGPDVCKTLLQYKWDKIFFTGSSKVGRLVLSAAAEHLTPVTLELGGKCPAIMDQLSSSWDAKVAVQRLVGGKWGCCNGQACVGVDYVLVEQQCASKLVDMLKEKIKKLFGQDPQDGKSLSRIVNKRHFERLRAFLKDPRIASSIVFGGNTNEETLFIEPTILLDPPLDSEVMKEEIFGPILPIVTLRDIQESIEFVNSMPKPLAIYAFTKNETLRQRILSETSSGSITFNDVIIQFLCDSLPFGGVGESGMGRYHGKYSFDCFSHEKAVMESGFFPEIQPRYPPWNTFKHMFIRFAYRYDYFSLILLFLGFKNYLRRN